MTRAARLRELLLRPAIGRLVGARDGLTARLVEEAQFDGVWLSGFELSASRGLPDLGLLTMTESLESAVHVNQNTTLPVLADCDTGFGGPINVARTVQQYERAGVAGICIEDKLFPKRNSYLEDGQLLQDSEGFARCVEVAVQNRDDRDFSIVARCEALIAGGDVDEALRRAHCYVDAGADAVLIHSKRTDPTEVIEFARRWRRRAPLVAVPTSYGQWTAAEAQAAGVDLLIHANQALRASVAAIRNVLRAIHQSGATDAVDDSIATVKEIFDLTGTAEWLRYQP